MQQYYIVGEKSHASTQKTETCSRPDSVQIAWYINIDCHRYCRVIIT